jgi:tetratricopeptide (TPR) repeat protein
VHWRARQGWAHAALADNLRQQSELGDALDAARQAGHIFEEIGDSYGLVRATFLSGFCLRLRGQFAAASRHLEAAYQRAQEHGYAAFAADTLMQLGEVRRCQGDSNTAAEMLCEALGRATALQLPLTQAFAASSLAAAAHARGADEEALRCLRSAQHLFVKRAYADGIALNLRRHAIVLRMSADRKPGALAKARRMLFEALKTYARISSPAGEAACLVEGGFLALASNRNPERSCAELLKRLAEPSARRMLALDPWVASMIADLARTLSHRDLEVEARALLCQSRQILYKHETETVSTVTPDGASAHAQRPPADHMGGEPRRYRSHIAVVAMA